MNKMTFAVFAVLLLAPGLRTQEQAPTLDVCQADRAVWQDMEQMIYYFKQQTRFMSDDVRNTNPIAKLSVTELTLRAKEMSACRSVDTRDGDRYYEMLNFYGNVLSDRYYRFIVRHDLYAQFREEDAAGAR